MDDKLSLDSDAFSLVNRLQGYLKTECEFGLIIDSGKQSHVPLTIKISNTAPSDIKKPLIVFLGVKLMLTGSQNPDPMWAHTGGTNKHYQVEYKSVESPWFSDVGKSIGNYPDFPKITEDEKKYGNVLFPGESLTYGFIVPMNEMANIGFHVDGTISRRHLFYLKTIITLPEAYTRPPAVLVMQTFNKLELHKALDAVLSNLPDLTKEIRIADLPKEFIIAIMTGPTDLKELRTMIPMLFRELPRLSWLKEHINKTYQYIDHVIEVLTDLKISMETNNPSSFVNAASKLAEVSSEAIQLNKETEKIMGKYNISDEEVTYRYRTRS